MRTCLRWIRVLTVGALLGCSGTSPVEPTHTNVDLARAAWLENRSEDYSFQFSNATSWTPRSSFVRVTVAGGEVVAIRDLLNRPAQMNVPTIDEIWDRLLAARAANELNSAAFNRLGVPVEVDYGPWASDGGVAYWVRDFEAR